MDLKIAIFGIIMTTLFLELILFVFFGEKTVRKLRKNPATKNALGIEFVSGLDIANVMFAFLVPRNLARKAVKRRPWLVPDADLLEQYTTRFDRILARIIAASMLVSVSALLILFFLEDHGVFK
jgi:hypothetical protein